MTTGSDRRHVGFRGVGGCLDRVAMTGRQEGDRRGTSGLRTTHPFGSCDDQLISPGLSVCVFLSALLPRV
jgi:hypothetical protein